VTLLKAENVSKSFGGFQALKGASLSVNEGEIVGLIGPNGAGKSTFFNCLVGDMTPSSGTISFSGEEVSRLSPEHHARLGIGRTFQLPTTFEEMTLLENVMVGAFLRHPSLRQARQKATEVLHLTGMGDQIHLKAKTLGTPGRKRLEIARVLATEPRMMLLDEALAGLTPVEVQSAITLVKKIHQTGVTLVIVEHIMEVILNLTQRVLVLNQGEVIATGAPKDVVNDPLVIRAYLGASYARTAALGTTAIRGTAVGGTAVGGTAVGAKPT
jgi:branched-chain amino acid transport system ATP-binding protein